MLSGVLHSDRAIEANIAIMRAFVRLREATLAQKEWAKQLEEIERRVSGHDRALGAHAKSLKGVFKAIRQLMSPPEKPRPRIGFKP